MDPLESRTSNDRGSGRKPRENTPRAGDTGTISPTGNDLTHTTSETVYRATVEPVAHFTTDRVGQSADTPRNTKTRSTGNRHMNQTDKMDELATQAEQKADAGMQKTAEGLKKAADKARSMSGDQGGSMESIGTQAAGMMEKGADYLEHSDSEQMMQDLEAFVRRRPMESLLVAAGLGFLVSRALR